MNKIYNFILLAFVLMLQSVSASAASASETSLTKTVKINYQTINEFNKEVTLTATITLPNANCPQVTSDKVTKVMLSTSTDDKRSGFLAKQNAYTESKWSALTTSGIAVVEPGTLLSGISQLGSIPAFSYNLAGRQALDALYAAVIYMKSAGIITSDQYKSFIVGVGIGGNIALAAQRVLETTYSKEKSLIISLGNTYIDGLSGTPKQLLDSALSSGTLNIETAYQLIVLLDNMLKTYAENCMKTFTESDIFSEELTSSNILSLIYSNLFSETQIKAMLTKLYGTDDPTINQILSKTMLAEGSPVRRAIEKALEQNDVLSNWIPQTSIFYGSNSSMYILKSVSEVAKPYFQLLGYMNLSSVNTALAAVLQALGTKINTEMQYVYSVVNSILSGEQTAHFPLAFQSGDYYYVGYFYLNSNYKVAFKYTIYSSLTSKWGTIEGELGTTTTLSSVPATVTFTTDQIGYFVQTVSLTNAVPFFKYFTYFTGEDTFATEEEAQAVAATLNGLQEYNNISLNGITAYCKGSFGVEEAEEDEDESATEDTETTETEEEEEAETGSYVLDLYLTRGSNTCSVTKMYNYLGAE